MNGLEAALILTARYYLQFAKEGGAMVIFQSKQWKEDKKMADTYAILGFGQDMKEPVILFESDSSHDCARWKQGYTRFGDWGGYDLLALYEIAAHESAKTIHKTDAPILDWERGQD
jgi:hypothetical protein